MARPQVTAEKRNVKTGCGKTYHKATPAFQKALKTNLGTTKRHRKKSTPQPKQFSVMLL
jgi:hypothetical protein